MAYGKILPEDEQYMKLALEEASLAAEADEVPIGCVILWDGKVISRAHNQRERRTECAHTPDLSKTALAHAECEAIAEACRTLGGWRLHRATLYVTVEPCPMCAGAIINARIPQVYYGARDEQMGACGGVLNLFMERFPHTPALIGGVLAEECRAELERFFQKLR